MFSTSKSSFLWQAANLVQHLGFPSAFSLSGKLAPELEVWLTRRPWWQRRSRKKQVIAQSQGASLKAVPKKLSYLGTVGNRGNLSARGLLIIPTVSSTSGSRFHRAVLNPQCVPTRADTAQLLGYKSRHACPSVHPLWPCFLSDLPCRNTKLNTASSQGCSGRQSLDSKTLPYGEGSHGDHLSAVMPFS